VESAQLAQLLPELVVEAARVDLGIGIDGLVNNFDHLQRILARSPSSSVARSCARQTTNACARRERKHAVLRRELNLGEYAHLGLSRGRRCEGLATRETWGTSAAARHQLRKKLDTLFGYTLWTSLFGKHTSQSGLLPLGWWKRATVVPGVGMVALLMLNR
tara:strand:+ start:332 stop:814 length:483 start_codon:yes stop_codon:yes gene_type:complete